MIGHDTPEAMARVLVGYIACNRRVRSEVMSEFNLSTISLDRIEQIRRQRQLQDELFARGKDYDGADERGWDWRGIQRDADMDIASEVFVKAIERERAA